MAYIKQNWSEMQSNEIPLEAQHLEHIEEGLIDINGRIGDVSKKDTIEWQDLEFNTTSMGYFYDTVDNLDLDENKSYKVIITDAQNIEAAYDLTLIDAGLILEDFAGFKVLYHGDMHTGGNNIFLISQNSYFDMSKDALIPAEGMNGILLAGYKKAVIKEFTSTNKTESVITGLSQDYIEAAQTDFLCEDPDNIKYLRNKPFGKTIQKVSFIDFECKATEDPYLKLDLEIDLKPGRSYVLVAPDPANPNTTLETMPLLYYTFKDYLIAAGNSSLLENFPEEFYDIKILVTNDLDDIVITCGANPITEELETGTFYLNMRDIAFEYPGYSYRIEGINQTIDIYKKLSSEYTESPDFEENNPKLGTYIKNLPLGINLTIKNLVNIPELSTSDDLFSFVSSLTPMIGKNYTVYINDIAYPATCAATVLYDRPLRSLSGAFGFIYCMDRQDLIDIGYPEEQSFLAHGEYLGQFSSNLPGYSSNWIVSLRIEGPVATYRKLSSEYTPSINVSASDKNKLKTTKINGDYYLSFLSDGKDAGAISLTRDFSKLNLRSNNIANFVDTTTEEIITISNEPFDSEDELISGSLLLSSEANDNSSLKNFSNCGPILTAFENSYLYVIPSIPKVFRLTADGISVFADLSEYEATWQEYFSKVRGYIKLVYHGSTSWDTNKHIKIISRTDTTNLTLRISTSRNSYLDSVFETDKTFCTIYESNLEDLGSSSESVQVDLYDFGPVSFKNNLYSSRLLKTFNTNSSSGSTLLKAYSDKNASRPLVSESTYISNLCTTPTGQVYRYLDEEGIEHFRNSYIDSTDYTGKSNSRHSNYFYSGKQVNKLPGFSDSSNGSSGSYLTYTSNYEILVRDGNGTVLDSRQVSNGPFISNSPTSQSFLFLVNNCYLLVHNRCIYQIYEVNGELTTKNIGNISGSLVAQPMIMGNYLMLPTDTYSSSSSNNDKDIQCRFIKYIPLYKTMEQKVDSINSKLSIKIKDIQKDIQDNTSEVANKTMTQEINSLSTDLQIPTARAVFNLVYPNVSKEWSHVQEVVRSGLGPTIYPVGYEFTTWDSVNQQNITWVVVGHDHHKTVDDTFTHTMTLESKYVLCDQSGNTVYLDFCGKPTIFYYAKEGLPAGRYCLRGTNDYYVHYFTISKALAIPAGGCLKLAPGTGFSTSTGTLYLCNTLDDPGTAISYSSKYTRPTVEPSANYTYLGSLATNYANDSELVSTALFNNGSNNYAQSAIHQWLNSNADAGHWWTRQTVFDEAPSNGIALPGFLQSLPEDFKNVVQSVKIPCAMPYNGSVSSLDGSQFNAEDTQYELNTKFFLLSKKELNFYDAEEYDGYILEAFSETTATARPKYNLLNLSANAWTRTPYSTNSYSVGLYSGRSHAATNASGVAPACVIA